MVRALLPLRDASLSESTTRGGGSSESELNGVGGLKGRSGGFLKTGSTRPGATQRGV